MCSSWVTGILQPLEIISQVMIIRVGSNMTKNIVETKQKNDVMAKLHLYSQISSKIWYIYVPGSHHVRITYEG